MTGEHFDSLGLTLEEYYALPTAEKLEHNKEYMYNPFDERVRRGELPMMTWGSFELDGPWTDGVHLIANPFNFNFHRKFEVKDVKVIRAWEKTDDYKWKEIPKEEWK